MRVSAAGFSLIELLVALMVVVLLTSVVSLNIGDGGRDRARAEEVQRLAALITYAQSEAELSGADHGLLLYRENIDGEWRFRGQWRRRFDQGWSEPRGSDDVFEVLQFEPGVELLLDLVEQSDLEIAELDPELNPVPQIQMFASGEITEGALEWVDSNSGDLLFRLEWGLFGRMTILPRGEVPDDESF